jgi:4-diphosphocytidyl-2-C-methyl-D-erythritol kinase
VRLRALAPAKVNLCLFLGGVRADGRHELLTLFESVSMADDLVLEVLAGGLDQVHCPGVTGPNLAADALAGLRARGWRGPPVAIEIDKRIPVAAGMGGGSADAAAALRLAAAVSAVPAELVGDVALGLGADVPSQVAPGVAIGRGAGEVVEPAGALAPHAFLVLPQAFGLSTAAVYREADRLGLARPAEHLSLRARELDEALAAGTPLPRALLVNDLQRAALSLRPEIEQALDDARYAGAEHVMVSGSGPTVLGLFWGPDAAARASAGAAALAGRYPGATTAVPVDASFGTPQPA